MKRNNRNEYKRFYTEEQGIPAEIGANGPGTKNGKIANTVLVKLRERPSFYASVVGTARCGEEVEILSKEGRFCKVRTKDLCVVYIASEYIEEG